MPRCPLVGPCLYCISSWACGRLNSRLKNRGSDLHTNCLRGELVAIGVMTQLMMEKRTEEAEQAARFFKDVGLPLHLAQLGFDPLQRESELDVIVQHSLNVFFIHYEPFEITHGFLKAAILEADEFGKTMERSAS
jgi:glycerol dehydrogenase-like iron-containing ADH family enzyme